MCETSERSERSTAATCPSWLGLYGRAGLMLAALLLAQTLVAKGPELIGLECGLVLGGFLAMGRWARRNRAELDRLDWCECASSRVTVRVIPSRRGALAGIRKVETPSPVAGDPLTTIPIEAPVTASLVDAAR